MTSFTLHRVTQTDQVTLGRIEDDERRQVCVTLELPWRDNAHNLSCVPPGQYVAYRRWSPKRDCEVFQLKDVPGRDNIELHVGNFPGDTDGCILLGSNYGRGDASAMITGSRSAFNAFMALVAGENQFTLTILNP